MEEATSPVPLEELELSVLEEQAGEQTPLNGALQVLPTSAQDPCLDQASKKSPWSACHRNLIGRCKLWMAIISIFVGFIIVVILGLFLTGVTYVDEDEHEILELSTNKTFFMMLKIPEECVTEEELPHLLTERLTEVYSKSPSLSRYFTSVERVHFSGENATATYHLRFMIPEEDDSFMTYMMSEELVLGIVLQDFHDQKVTGCETLGLDPESLFLYE
ncbi:TPA-induced transmembrane protein [Perognathus longimembris pacificus]|uniref:TPA-induced transmembrane protein n=1 Tax=Perognathus longimembris pacificus TaxID=214514 RepID=UPI002018D963|nr:TPA-induced transmembrane protein [Perognathus longimembris pacificus]